MIKRYSIHKTSDFQNFKYSVHILVICFCDMAQFRKYYVFFIYMYIIYIYMP